MATQSNSWVPKEAEAAALGACLVDPDTVIVVAGIIGPDDFGVPAHGWLAAAIWQCLAERLEPARPVVIAKLRAAGRWADKLSPSCLSIVDLDLFANAVNEADIRHAPANAITIRECAFRRRGASLLHSTAEKVSDPARPFEALQPLVLDTLSQMFDPMDTRDAGIDAIGAARLAAVDSGQSQTGLLCGLDWLDKETGGFQPAETWVLAAPYKARKTTLALNFALSIACAGQAVSVFTVGDSSREATWDKLLAMGMNRAMIGNADYMQMIPASSQGLRHAIGDKRLKVLRDEAAVILRGLPIRLYDGRDLTFNLGECERNVRRDSAMHGTRLFVYDYAQAANAGKNDYERTTAIANWNQRIIGELGISSLILSQLNEETVKSDNGENYSPGAKGGGALPAMANVFLSSKYVEPFVTLELKLSRDSAQGAKYRHALHPGSGLILNTKGERL